MPSPGSPVLGTLGNGQGEGCWDRAVASGEQSRPVRPGQAASFCPGRHREQQQGTSEALPLIPCSRVQTCESLSRGVATHEFESVAPALVGPPLDGWALLGWRAHTRWDLRRVRRPWSQGRRSNPDAGFCCPLLWSQGVSRKPQSRGLLQGAAPLPGESVRGKGSPSPETGRDGWCLRARSPRLAR